MVCILQCLKSNKDFNKSIQASKPPPSRPMSAIAPPSEEKPVFGGVNSQGVPIDSTKESEDARRRRRRLRRRKLLRKRLNAKLRRRLRRRRLRRRRLRRRRQRRRRLRRRRQHPPPRR